MNQEIQYINIVKDNVYLCYFISIEGYMIEVYYNFNFFIFFNKLKIVYFCILMIYCSFESFFGKFRQFV